jgi:hypothetical protein
MSAILSGYQITSQYLGFYTYLTGYSPWRNNFHPFTGTTIATGYPAFSLNIYSWLWHETYEVYYPEVGGADSSGNLRTTAAGIIWLFGSNYGLTRSPVATGEMVLHPVYRNSYWEACPFWGGPDGNWQGWGSNLH